MGKFAVITQQAPVAPGTQDFVRAGFGVPIGFIVIGTKATATTGGVVDVQESYGFSDLVNQFAMGIFYEDASATPILNRQTASDRVLTLHNVGATQDFTASFNGLVKDGIQLNFTDAVAGLPRITVILIGGADFKVKAITGITPAVVGTVPSPAVGFEADDLFWITAGSTQAFDTPAVTVGGAGHGIGLCDNDGAGGVTMRSSTVFWNFFSGLNRNSEVISDAFIMQRPVETGATDQRIALEAFTDNGFTIRETNFAGFGLEFAAFCMQWGERTKSIVSDLDSPASATPQLITTPQFKPQFLMTLPSRQAAYSTTVDSTNVSSIAIGAADNTLAQVGNAWRSLGGVVTSDSESQARAKVVGVFDELGADVHEAAVTSFDPLGFTLGWDTAISGDKQMYLAVGETPALRSVGGGATVAGAGKDRKVSVGMRPSRAPGS